MTPTIPDYNTGETFRKGRMKGKPKIITWSHKTLKTRPCKPGHDKLGRYVMPNFPYVLPLLDLELMKGTLTLSQYEAKITKILEHMDQYSDPAPQPTFDDEGMKLIMSYIQEAVEFYQAHRNTSH